MNSLLCLLLFLCTVHFMQKVDSAWWKFSQFDQMAESDHHMYCKILPHLNKRQRQICNRHSNLVEVMGQGIKAYGITECQFQFRYQKWNCSTFVNDSFLFGKSLVKGGTREIAFLQAMLSASAIYKLAKTCSKGNPTCGCSLGISNGHPNQPRFDRQFKWNGCEQVVKFSTNFVRRFADASEMRASDAQAKFTLHNNRVGRIVVRRKLTQSCVCHGFSGSCTLKSCWARLPSFRAIGDVLRDNYDSAVEITFKPSGRIIPLHKGHRRPNKRNLIYYEASPDYCRLNVSLGSMGTRNRVCSETDHGEESCNILCCNHKYETVKVSYSQYCNCTFSWCCKVNCRICNVTRLQYHCKY